jgi:hypothetical protein
MDGDDGALDALVWTGSLEAFTDADGRTWWRLTPAGRVLLAARFAAEPAPAADRLG